MPQRQLTTAALVAKEIRSLLRKKFPAVKFRVRSSNFAGGDSVDVDWDFGPTEEQVDQLLGIYRQGTFNGMDDSYTYFPAVLVTDETGATYQQPRVRWVTATRTYGPNEMDVLQRVARWLRRLQGQDDAELSPCWWENCQEATRVLRASELTDRVRGVRRIDDPSGCVEFRAF